MKTPDLIEILKQQTEQKGSATQPNPDDFEQVKEEQAPNPEDFEPQPEPEPTPEPENTNDFTAFSQPQQQKPQKPILTDAEYRQNAKMWIALVDGLGTISLPWAYQKQLFTKPELKALKELNKRKKEAGSSGEITYTEADLKLLEKYEVFNELKENIPFQEEEIQMIENPLTEVFKKYNFQPGPEVALITAASIIMAPRLLPLLSGFEK